MKILFCSDHISSISKNINITVDIEYVRPENLLEVELDSFDALVGFGLKDIDISNFRWIHSLGAGVDWIINNSSLDDDTIITRMVTGFGTHIFEYILSRVLIELNNVLSYIEYQKEKLWKPLSSKLLHNSKIIILGTGSIGTEIAKGFNLLGCDVFGINSSGKKNKQFRNIYTMSTLALQNYDEFIIVNTLPLTSKTKNIINKEFLSKFKAAMFINVGRSEAVVESDLIEAMKSGQISSAWLDVFKEEPLLGDSELWDMKNVYITPHISGPTQIADLLLSFENTYKAISNNKNLVNRVDIQKGY